jgi:hypothetical protein
MGWLNLTAFQDRQSQPRKSCCYDLGNLRLEAICEKLN